MSSSQPSRTDDQGWTWDPSLYAGSASFYPVGRVAYPAEVADLLADALQLDGTGVLLDVGCGPGSLTLLLARHFAEGIGVDADSAMLVEASRQAAQRRVDNVSWRHLRAEDLPADLPAVQVATFAQSFHWMDRPRVAGVVRTMLVKHGALVHVHATTHQGMDIEVELPHPRPPREAIAQLVQQYLGLPRRAGLGVLPAGTPGEESKIYTAAGFSGPQRLEVAGRAVVRSAAEIAASIYSLSSSTPHLFGDRLGAFDAELQELLSVASPDGRFSEQMAPIVLDVWR